MAGQLFTWGPSNVDTLLSTTLSKYRKSIADNIFTRIPLFNWLKSKSLTKLNGGASIIVPLMYAKNSTAAPYSGYGIINTTPQEGITAAQYIWSQYAATVSLSGLEISQNKGDSALISLLDAKVKQAEMSLRDKLDIDLWASTQATNGLLNLPSVVDTTTTIGNVSKSANSWWQAQVTASGSFAARGLSDFRNTYNTILNQSVDGSTVDFMIGAQLPFEYYEASLQPQQRFANADMASAGFETVKYKAATMTFDTNAPSGTVFFLRSENLNLTVHTDRNFLTTPFIQPTNQDAKVAQILFMGQVVSDNIRKLGKLTGVTA